MKKTLLMIPVLLGISACSHQPTPNLNQEHSQLSPFTLDMNNTHSIYGLSLKKGNSDIYQAQIILANDKKENLNLYIYRGYLSEVTQTSKTCNPKLTIIKKTKNECIQDISPSRHPNGYHGYVIKHNDSLTIHLEQDINNYTFDKTFPLANYGNVQLNLNGTTLTITRH